MKARVKATGEIVEVIQVGSYINEFGTLVGEYKDADGIMYISYDLDFYIEDNIIIPDYWTRLEHQYAGMAMQQLVHLVNVGYEYAYEETAIIAMNFAHALVEKLKEKEE